MSDNIKVVVKVRPLISREIDEKLSHQWRVGNNTLSQIESGREYASFTFDKVYDESSKTSEVYNDVAKPIVEAAMAGFNGTIFAYGQTSSGKTYTMAGCDSSPGIIPLAINDLFEFIKNKPDRDFLVRVSYIEIYNETVRDLLDIDKKNIKIQDTHSGGVKVDVHERVTATAEEVFDAMKQGNASRQTGATNMNEESSRSHSIFQIIIESREHIEGEEESGCVNVSQLNLVDLAGSERAGQTGATGLRFKEGTHINKSLSALALVIKQLSEEVKGASRYISYRDSKLTRILQHSLGGNAKTCIICAVTPAVVEETISTLQFANRAKAITNKPEVNEVATDATMIQRLTKKLSTLQTQLESKMNVEQDNVNLQKQIANLRRVILTGLAKPAPVGRLSRKLPPRRATISALETVPENPLPSVPKFCTPSLKYNPLNMAGAPPVPPPEGRLCSVIEELRVITPPPLRQVSFGSDVIEIDSDDGDEKCSPYHKCYDTSKTPPCILRQNAKQAKKTLLDLVELTEREKIYTPEINELIQKLESKACDNTKLQEEVNSLQISAKERDSTIHELKVQLNKAEEDIKCLNNDKALLESRCKEQDTKLTDCEVGYETLKTKAKIREQELLSLLEDHKINKAEDIGKIKNKTFDHFMDMSKDISLVNSDNESSICPAEDDNPLQLHDLVKELQLQINSKIQMIRELESNIATQKDTIDSLDIGSQELHQTISNLQNGLTLKENENDFLKSLLETHTTTNTRLKENLEAANRDIESYNNVVQELQIKLANRDNILNVSITDSLLESMISNEQKFIANNENINNIIISFKKALENRNKEIIDLNIKLAMHNDFESNKCIIEEELQNKENLISGLKEKLETLTSKYDENIITIYNLQTEKNINNQIEKELASQLSNLKDENNKLNNLSEKLTAQIRELKENNNNLIDLLSEKETMQQNMLKKSEELHTESKLMSYNIVKLYEEISRKDEIIASLKNADQKSKEYLTVAKSALIKLQGILNVMKSDTVFSENVEELEVQADTLQDRLDMLEIVANKVMSEKEQVLKYNLELKNELNETVEKHSSEVTLLRTHIESLNNIKNEISNELFVVKNNLAERTIDYESLRKELHETKELYGKKISYEKITKDEFSILELERIELIDAFKQKSEMLESALKTKENEIFQLRQDMIEREKMISSLDQKLNSFYETTARRDNLIESILQKVSNIHCRTNNTNLTLHQGDIIKQIIKMLDDIDKNIISNNESDHDGSNSDNETKDSPESKNIDLQHDSINIEDNELHIDLQQISKELLNSLHKELETKSHDIQLMEVMVHKWKDQFINLDKLMKQQIQELIQENESLKKALNLEKVYVFNDTITNLECNVTKQTGKSISIRKKVAETHAPKSLCSISLEKVFSILENNLGTNINSNSESTADHSDVETQICCCYELTHKLTTAQQQILDQTNYILLLKSNNNQLKEEYENLRKEVNLLLEPANELRKRIVNHRTNLSTLTATTFAENKLLKSQVTALQHHHNRFHNVCQRDIPALKKQLLELMTILKDSSFTDKHDASFKRYSLPDVLDSNTTLTQYKNESTLDGDLLMLDTNVTLATIDNTLMGYDQTCLDIPQNYLTNDVTNDLSQISEFKVNDYVKDSHSIIVECEKCVQYNTQEQKLQMLDENLTEEAKTLKEQFREVEIQKKEIEEKYNNLTLEMPSPEKLVNKISILDYMGKLHEIERLTKLIKNKNEEILVIQDENDSLSNQVMDNISELDNLKKEFDALRESNAQLCKEYLLLKSTATINKADFSNCPKQPFTETHSMLNRSFSDSDTTTRYNKICTLHSELLAGREDCQEITQDVATIKNHLQRSNISVSENMNLDDSMGDSNNFSFTKDCNLINQSRNCRTSDIPEECDVYSLEKQQCFTYYIEKTGVAKENLDTNMKIIDIMKSFHDSLLAKHGNEVENLMYKLHDYEDLITELKKQFDAVSTNYSKASKELKENVSDTEQARKLMEQIQCNYNLLNEEAQNMCNKSMDCNSMKLLETFKENILLIIIRTFNVLDAQSGVSNVSILRTTIDSLISKLQHNLKESEEKYSKLQDQMDNISKEFSSVNDNLNHQKSQLLAKENEYKLLKAQKEAVHEISNAVTLDIIQKENELKDILSSTYQRLVQNKIINQEEVDLRLSPVQSVDKLFECFQYKHNINISEINNYKTVLEENESELTNLRLANANIQRENSNMSDDLVKKEKTLQEQKCLYEDLNKLYETKLEENRTMSNQVGDLTEELKLLRLSMLEKEAFIQNLEDKITAMNPNIASGHETTELIQKVNSLEEELLNMISVNNVLANEKNEYAAQLEKCGETIKQNNEVLQKMTSEILILRESVNEKTLELDRVKSEADALYKETVNLKENLAEKSRDCSRLEINIKTHEKTAEIQSKMIIRLQKQKDENDTIMGEKDKKLDDLAQKCTDLQAELNCMRNNIEAANEEVSILKKTKLALEERISKLEIDLKKQSHDTQKNTRQSGENNEFEDDGAETVFGARGKPDDLFMDVDDGASDRSTPIRLSRGRDSFASRMDHSSSLEPHSRPSSVQATRRRRQSLHDALRTTLQDLPNDRSRHSDDLNNKSSETSATGENEVSRLKERLAMCERELEELKERYRELDEECEICATYLREREQQVSKLKKEMKALELELSELKSQKLATEIQKNHRSVAHASVNTDEDWANLHSVVVDRMSYDAEVDKNKRLTKTIEELRFKKQDLKNTLAKMHKALEKSSCNRELEATKTELRSCKQELAELRVKYKELDDECETCALYLREKDEQLRRLREAKAALEAKMCEYVSNVARSRRHAAHDASRDASDLKAKHVFVQTTDDLLTHYVERDDNSQRENEVKRLKMNVEKLYAQKASLEQQIANSAQQPTMYVAAGSAIVQSQQISDIMKENHKLKKINAKLVDICKKRGKPLAESNRDSENNIEECGVIL